MAKITNEQKFRELCLSIPLSVALSSIAVLSYQGTLWLKHGCWQPLGSRLLLYRILPANFLQWLNKPDSWLGLKKVVLHTFDWPLALFLFLFGMAVLLLLILVFDLFSKPVRTKKTKTKITRSRNWRRV